MTHVVRLSIEYRGLVAVLSSNRTNAGYRGEWKPPQRQLQRFKHLSLLWSHVMKSNLKLFCSAILAITILAASIRPVRATDEKAELGKSTPKIQMAILLDTSGSMRGLINQARTQLWKIVNEFTSAKRDGLTPTLEVAIYEYGHASLGAQTGFMRQVVPITDNLDQVSEELFKLQVGGSKEFCGQVIDKAVKELKWSKSNRDLKCIFIAGNEPFTQGPVDFREACKAAAGNNITVSTIYCGPNADGVNTSWLEASKLADGSYMSIDHNQQVASIDAPQDKQLVELNTRLNSTYVAYGGKKDRENAAKRQTEQDSNALKSSPATNSLRIQVKGSALYNNAGWDLCDACRLKRVKLEDLKEDQLPEFMRKMTLKERKTYIDKKIAERTKIQKEIKQLSEERQKYVAAELKKQAGSAEASLDTAIIAAAREQAAVKQFSFDK